MVVLFADGEVVVHHDLLKHTLVQNPRHVDAVSVDLEIREDGLYAILLLREAGDGA